MGVFLLPLVLLLILSGCANRPDYKLSKEYKAIEPRTIVIMPTSGAKADIEARDLFRAAVLKKLAIKNYYVTPLTQIDNRFKRLGAEQTALLTPEEVCSLFKADAVLYPEITTWNKNLLLTYGSLRVGARFKLYAKNGSLLWKGSFKTREFDIRFDRDQVKLAIVKAYEPRIQRIVEAVFLTLPSRDFKQHEKEFFRWLK